MSTEQAPVNAFQIWTESVSAWRDLSRSAGEAWMDALMSMNPGPDDAAPEAATRDLFRKLADLNLQHWENAAKVIEAMPAWMRWPQTVPGDMLTDWFDRMRRETPAQAFTPFMLKATPASAPEEAPLANAPRQPSGLAAPEGDADDLTRIKGIGPKLSKTLNELGIYHFRQIAGWQSDEADWVDDYLSFKGRVMREQWIEQAQKFASNGALH